MARLLKLGIYDPAYLAAFYADRPGLSRAPYAVQHAALIGDRAASSDFWTTALAGIGYETADIVANAAPLQQQWAAENGLAGGGEGPFGVAAAQIRAFAPEILLVADYSTFTGAFLRAVRADCRSLERIVGWCGAPYRNLDAIREWDLALSCVPELVSTLRAGGLAAHHVDHGFDPRVLGELAPPTARTAFSFVGSVVKAAGFHRTRERLLVRLLQDTPLELWSGAALPARPASLRQKLGRMVKPGAGALDPLVRQRARPPLYGLAMFQRLRDSAVTLNTHIDASHHSASNMRLFEATGVGTCLLTDWKKDIARLFEPDSEVITYSSADEAVEKYRWLASHPAQAAEIAAAGQRRVFTDHGFDRRAARIDEILRSARSAR